MSTNLGIPKAYCTMALLALDATYYSGKSFNAGQFAAMVGKDKPNRHTRAVLNLLVKMGRLKKESLLHEDGKYRLVYSARINVRQMPLPLETKP